MPTGTKTDTNGHQPDPTATAVGFEVELFGVPRLLAGQPSLRVAGGTLGEVAAALAVACPALRGRVVDADGAWLIPGYTFVVDERFAGDGARDRRLAAAASVLLVSSVAGG